MAVLRTYEIVELMEEDNPDATPLALVEATGKKAAMTAVARGMGGHTSNTKTYQQNRPILWLYDKDEAGEVTEAHMCVARLQRR